MATHVDNEGEKRAVWITCDRCGRNQPEWHADWPTRKDAEIAARRHDWKPRVKRPEGYLDLCNWCWGSEGQWRLLQEALRKREE